LARIRNAYNLKPEHKLKYDLLYIKTDGNLNFKQVQEKEIAVESITRSSPAVGLISRLRILSESQRSNLQSLSALVVFNFLAAGLSFVAQVKIANVIGKERFGLLAYGIALGMYGQVIARYGMDRTLVRDLIHYPNRFAELVMASLLLRGLLLGLVVAALLLWKIIWKPANMTWPVIAVVVAYSLKSLDLHPVYDAWQCMARHAAYNLVQRGLYFILIWAVVLTIPQRLSLAWVGFGLLATEVFYLFLQQRWAGRRIRWSWNSLAWNSAVAALFKNNVWLWLATIASLSFGSLNQIMLKHYCGAAELGSYAASWQIVAVALLLLSQVGRIGNPATARITRPQNNARSRKSFLLKYCCVMFITALPVGIPSILFPGWIMATIFKPEYASSAPVLRLLGIYIMVYSLGLVASQYVVSLRMEKVYFTSVITGGILSVLFCFFFIPKLGGMGAAISLLIAHGVSMGLYMVATILQVRNCE